MATQEESNTTLSPRGSALADAPSFRAFATPVLTDLYDPIDNPSGAINLGAAENFPALPSVSAFANRTFASSPSTYSYNEGAWGTARLRRGLAKHMNRYFHPVVPIEPNDILVAAGVMALCELLGFALCEPGDAILMSSPIYAAFVSDFGTKAGVHCVNASFQGTDQFAPGCVEHYERTLREANAAGKKVRALLICHPHNPLGQPYPRETLIALMQLCQKHQIHLISDEIYALSNYSVPELANPVLFESVLAFDSSAYIESKYLHVLYGLSKDFAAGGLRVGCMYTRNRELWNAISAMTQFHWIGGANDEVACRLLEDEKWLDGFFAESKERLGRLNAIARGLLRDKGIGFWEKANSGFFLWVDLRPFLARTEKQGWEAEEELVKRLVEKKVYVSSGASMRAEEPGWLRVVFSVEEDILQEGFRRFFEALAV